MADADVGVVLSLALRLLFYAFIAAVFLLCGWLYDNTLTTKPRWATHIELVLRSSAAMNWLCERSAAGRHEAKSEQKLGRRHSNVALQYLWCFLGLQMSFLSWGYLQERIITMDYGAVPFCLVLRNGFCALPDPCLCLCLFFCQVQMVIVLLNQRLWSFAIASLR